MTQKTVLIIDDESDTRVYLFDLLTSHGYRVVTYENPSEALRQIHDVRPDAVVLDIYMPHMSGTDLLPMLRLAAPDVPVLVFSAYADPEKFLEALDKGARDVMSKPFEGIEVLRRIDQMIGT